MGSVMEVEVKGSVVEVKGSVAEVKGSVVEAKGSVEVKGLMEAEMDLAVAFEVGACWIPEREV